MPYPKAKTKHKTVFHMQSTWPWVEKLSTGKWERGGCVGQQPSQSTLNPQAVTVATIKNKATVITGEVGNISVEVMFDSGSAVLLLRKKAWPK